jgi:hypothetical protein
MERGSSTNNALSPEQANKRAKESNAGLLTFMMIGRYMVALAAKNEPNRQVRQAKRRQLVGTWNSYTNSIVARA